MKGIIVPVFQDVIDFKSGRICWVEALARIQTDATGKGHVPLIKLAESYGFVHHIDCTMAGAVIGLLDRIEGAVSINVSVATIERNGSYIVDLLRAIPGGASRIIVEITETVVISDHLSVVRFVRDVKRLGCKIAVDDFGDGFFTADIVRSIAPEIIKLSMALVNKVVEQRQPGLLDDIRIVADSIGADLLAEGLDSQMKIDLMRKLGCRFGQGYAIGMPTPFQPDLALSKAWPGTAMGFDAEVYPYRLTK